LAVATTPSGAEVLIQGGETPINCVSPCAVQVKRQDNLTVTVSKPGYQPQVIPLSKEIAGTGAAGFAGNLLLGGVIGMAVDGVSGAALDHKPNPVIVTLEPEASPPPPPVAKRKVRPKKPPVPSM
jgi:hypothetical protein